MIQVPSSPAIDALFPAVKTSVRPQRHLERTLCKWARLAICAIDAHEQLWSICEVTVLCILAGARPRRAYRRTVLTEAMEHTLVRDRQITTRRAHAQSTLPVLQTGKVRLGGPEAVFNRQPWPAYRRQRVFSLHENAVQVQTRCSTDYSS